MRKTWILRLAVPFVLLAGAAPASAGEPAEPGKGREPAQKTAPEDPALVGEEVKEQSDIERILETEHRKRRTAHFALETSLDADACKELVAFCEKSYREFLAWAGKPPDTWLWAARAQVVVIDRKTEWQSLILHRHRGEADYLVNEHLFTGADWDPSPPLILFYSHEGSDRKHDEFTLFHYLNHFFLHGLAGSGRDGIVWWLWEGFSWHRSAEVFGFPGRRCVPYDRDVLTREEQAWTDPDEWVRLLKQEVRENADVALVQFFQKGVTRIEEKTHAKGWSLVRYLVRDEEERAKFVRFVSTLKTSQDQARALEECHGLTPEGLDAAWREWILTQPNRWWKGRRPGARGR
jgi:hypothetical protein